MERKRRERERQRQRQRADGGRVEIGQNFRQTVLYNDSLKPHPLDLFKYCTDFCTSGSSAAKHSNQIHVLGGGGFKFQEKTQAKQNNAQVTRSLETSITVTKLSMAHTLTTSLQTQSRENWNCAFFPSKFRFSIVIMFPSVFTRVMCSRLCYRLPSVVVQTDGMCCCWIVSKCDTTLSSHIKKYITRGQLYSKQIRYLFWGTTEGLLFGFTSFVFIFTKVNTFFSMAQRVVAKMCFLPWLQKKKKKRRRRRRRRKCAPVAWK